MSGITGVLLRQAMQEARGVLLDLKRAERTLATPGEMYRAQGRAQLAAAIGRLERGLSQAELFRL